MWTPYRVYHIQPSLASRNMLVGREEELYTHLRGAFSIARFDNLGNARAYESWNEHQAGSTFFYAYVKLYKITANQGVVGTEISYEKIYSHISHHYGMFYH